MKFEELLAIIDGRPVFNSGLLRAGDVDTVDIASQLSRWVNSGRLIQLRRGVYALPEEYRSRAPHPFEVANLLVRPSYVSLESALSYHGVIPEAVFTATSVTSARADEFLTPLGAYSFRHIASRFFWGYTTETVSGAESFVARPEKALLDLVYLRPGAGARSFLHELRLAPGSLDLDALAAMAARWGRPKLQRAAELTAALMSEAGEWEEL
ncbi:MAG: type IV toxin-antitoxin system AbiEi family antitoxin domain-containing protein [Coriobacteriia bacterium]|nr:type IV toxin-antitoxin system AbiEi family antitoxin domain-containing protein [Coriobacteriia bacterium]